MIDIKNEKEFEEEVLKSELPVLVDFWAPWCGPCKAISPILKQLEEDNPGKLKIVKVDIDENENLVNNFRIRSVPTLMIFKNGNMEHQSVGSISKTNLQTILYKYI